MAAAQAALEADSTVAADLPPAADGGPTLPLRLRRAASEVDPFSRAGGCPSGGMGPVTGGGR